MHPGQYTVLNSENGQVVRAAIEELEVHAEILDAMGMGPEAVIVLHVGGRSGGFGPALDRFERGFSQPSQQAQEGPDCPSRMARTESMVSASAGDLSLR